MKLTTALDSGDYSECAQISTIHVILDPHTIISCQKLTH